MPPTHTESVAPKRRDAAKTRQLLLHAARQRFAYDGYAATTVRDIADDAGVNVALISRYFESKEGLFAACLTDAVDEFRRTEGKTSLSDIPQAIARRTVGSSCAEERQNAAGDPGRLLLLLLLRSSGDERAEQTRLGFLRSFSERLASAAGWRTEDPDGDRLLLRAQVVLATSIGIALLRSAPGLEPLTSATETDLVEPLRDMINALLSDR